MKFKAGTEWFRKTTYKPNVVFAKGQKAASGKSFPLHRGKVVDTLNNWKILNFMYKVD